MKTYFHTQRIAAMVSFVTSLILVSGCRSASVNSPDRASSSSGSWGAPFYRSFERSPRPYDDVESPNLEPIPPDAIPPVPGYSEPTPAIPPAPSAQKSRWKPKLPTFAQQSQVNQTAAKSEGKNGSAKLGGIRSSQWTSKSNNGEVVRARSANTDSQPELAAAVPVDDVDEHDVVISPGHDEGDVFDQPVIEPPKLQTPIKTRHGVIREWPAGPRSTSNSKNARSHEPVLGLPENHHKEADGTEDMPLLLPPSA
ncbi:hypothetical protein [Schlesneria paludicola]|uniref:hypothetical protein n=1 Tax=Schlesneria paludicola TaxID=360056 RepID=UPI00029B48D5|nr:hypothetical protein [Schlesneria paludicola]